MLQNKLAQKMSGGYEELTGYNAQISSDHSYIHRGLAFTAVINTGSISSAYYIGLTTPTETAKKYIHWRPVGITSSADYIEAAIYEGDSFTGGTAVTPINRNRNATATTAMQAIAKGVTSTPAGIVLASEGIGSGGSPITTSGGGGGSDLELLLKPNTGYILKLEPAGATTCILELFWYEEDGDLAS